MHNLNRASFISLVAKFGGLISVRALVSVLRLTGNPCELAALTLFGNCSL